MNRTVTIQALLLFLIPFLPASRLTAQYNYSIKNFNTSNGLPLNEVTAMTMDYDGYLWLGTRSSLIRYDGVNLKTFIIKKEGNEIANTVSYLMNIPPDKKVMVKMLGNHVLYIQNGKPVTYSDSIFGPGGWAPVYGHFPSLSLYEKFYKSIFNLFLENKFHPDMLDLLPVNDTGFIAGRPEKDELIYFKGNEKPAIIKMGVNLKKFISSKGYKFLLDEKNTMHLFDKDLNQFRKINIGWESIQKAGSNILDAVFYSDQYSGESFCLFNSTLYLLNFDPNQNLIRFTPQFSIKDKTHFWTGITYDSTHSTFFMSTLNEGFFQIKLQKIQTFDINTTLPKDVNPGNTIYYTLLKTSDSTAVIPTGFQFTGIASGGINIKKLGNLFGERETLGLLPGDNLLATLESHLYYYSAKDGYHIRRDFNDYFNRNNKIQVQLVYPEGDSVWASTNDAVFCFKNNEATTVFDKTIDRADSNHCEWDYFYRINKHEAFVSNMHGLYRLHTSAPYKMDPIPGMKEKLVRTICPFKDVLFLAAYKDGLFVYKNDRFYKVPLPETLPELAACQAAFADNNGYIWITTTKGLFKSTASSLVASALNNGPIPFFFYYGKDDGIPNIEFSGGGNPPYAVLNGGLLLLPSRGGIVSVKTGEMNEQIINTPISIESISTDNKKDESTRDSIRLDPNFKFLVITLSVPNFWDTKNLFIEFRLDNKEWTELSATDNMKITLAGISSGTHKLTIRKRTGYSDSDYVYTVITIFKTKNIYEQAWFYIVSLLLLIGMIWLFLKLKTQSINSKRIYLQKKVNEQTTELSQAGEIKDLLISIISHDMITPLRHVSLVAEILGKGLEKDPEKATEALLDIKTTSDRILTGSMSIINWMKYNNKKIHLEKKLLNLYSITNETLEIYIPIARSKNITLSNEVPKSKFVEVDYTIFTTILNNLISNAIKYTHTGEIRIFPDSSDTEPGTVLKISDTGIGMNEQVLHVISEVLSNNLEAVKSTSKVSTGLGYIMISELVKIHQITVAIESSPGKGTTVALTIDNKDNS